MQRAASAQTYSLIMVKVGMWGIDGVIGDLQWPRDVLWLCFTLLGISCVQPAVKWHIRGALGPADSQRTRATSVSLNPIPCLTLSRIIFGQVSDKIAGCSDQIDLSPLTEWPSDFWLFSPQRVELRSESCNHNHSWVFFLVKPTGVCVYLKR